jgi:hypothetical protein
MVRIGWRLPCLAFAALLLLAGCEAGAGASADSVGGDQATPTVGAAATANFRPIKLTGSGTKVPKFKIPADAAAIATISEKGSSNFVVTSLAANGAENDLLVNEIGSFAGTVLFDTNAGEHSVALKVESDGAWAITIKPIASARAWKPTGRLSGRGDDVVRVTPPVAGLAIAIITNRGPSNFVVTAYTSDGSGELLVNEIGNYSGQTTLPDGTILLQVESVGGTWTITPS